MGNPELSYCKSTSCVAYHNKSLKGIINIYWVYNIDGLVRVHHKNFTGEDAPCEGCDCRLNQMLDWPGPIQLNHNSNICLENVEYKAKGIKSK